MKSNNQIESGACDVTKEDWLASADSYLSLAIEFLQQYGKSRKGLQGYRRHMRSYHECCAKASSA